MSIEVLEPERIEEIEVDRVPATGDLPPIYGRCPVCNKPLFPRCRITGQPKCPPVGTGYESRARCSGCGAIICYAGNGNWKVLSDDDLTEDDRMADKLGLGGP